MHNLPQLVGRYERTALLIRKTQGYDDAGIVTETEARYRFPAAFVPTVVGQDIFPNQQTLTQGRFPLYVREYVSAQAVDANEEPTAGAVPLMNGTGALGLQTNDVVQIDGQRYLVRDNNNFILISGVYMMQLEKEVQPG